MTILDFQGAPVREFLECRSDSGFRVDLRAWWARVYAVCECTGGCGQHDVLSLSCGVLSDSPYLTYPSPLKLPTRLNLISDSPFSRLRRRLRSCARRLSSSSTSLEEVNRFPMSMQLKRRRVQITRTQIQQCPIRHAGAVVWKMSS